MSKCDFCKKEAVHFGSHGCVQACSIHVPEAEEVEGRMWDAMAEEHEYMERLRYEQNQEGS